MAGAEREKLDNEILPFLSLEARTDVKCVALQYVMGLTGSDEGRSFLTANTKYLCSIVELCEDPQIAISKDAYLALINLTTEEKISDTLLELDLKQNIIKLLLETALSTSSTNADPACMILSNITRSEGCAEKVIEFMIDNESKIGFEKVITAFCRKDHNKSANLDYLGPFLSNLTQVCKARAFVMDKTQYVIQRLLAFTEYKASLTRRGGIVGTLRNCCFETDYHEWLLSEDVDILPRLLLPLAGPEEFDEDDTEKLPPDLQYLEPDKEREADPDIRKMLVESVHKLCATKKCRLYVKDKNAYVILRELHKWEQDDNAIVAIENLVSVLISDEPEPGMENLDAVEIPKDIKDKLDNVM